MQARGPRIGPTTFPLHASPAAPATKAARKRPPATRLCSTRRHLAQGSGAVAGGHGLEEDGLIAASTKDSLDLAMRTAAVAFETKQVLHLDAPALSSRHLGNGDDA